MTGRGDLQGYNPIPLPAGALCFLVSVVGPGAAVTCHLSGPQVLLPPRLSALEGLHPLSQSRSQKANLSSLMSLPPGV